MLNGASETIQNKAKEQNGRFHSMLLGTPGATLLKYILTWKGINRAGEGNVRADYRNEKGRKAIAKGHKLKSVFIATTSYN